MDDKSEVYDVPAIRAKLLQKMKDDPGAYPTLIEQRFPRILAKIADLWGKPALDQYLDVLMFTDRSDRQGFPPEIATEVFRLSTAHAALNLAKQTKAIGWSGVDEALLERKAFGKDE
jgi:hypothetical protein